MYAVNAMASHFAHPYAEKSIPKHTCYFYLQQHYEFNLKPPSTQSRRSVALGTLYNDMVAFAEPFALLCKSLLCSTLFNTSRITSASAISLALLSGGGVGVSRGADSVTLARRSGPLSLPGEMRVRRRKRHCDAMDMCVEGVVPSIM
jgi:hypothetical protein